MHNALSSARSFSAASNERWTWLCARPQLAALPLAAGSFFAGMGAHKAWSQLNYLLEPGLERIGSGLPAAWRG